MKKRKVVTIQIIWLRPKYREPQVVFAVLLLMFIFVSWISQQELEVGILYKKFHCQISDSFASSGKTILREKWTIRFP